MGDPRSCLGLLLVLCAGCAATPPAVPGLRKISFSPEGQRWLAADAQAAQDAGAGPTQVLAAEGAAAGDRVYASLKIEPQECALILGRASASVTDVDLFAYAEDGAVLGSDERLDARPGLLLCPPHPETVYVVGRVATGHGIVALGAQRVAPERADRVRKALSTRDASSGGGFGNGFGDLDQADSAHRLLVGGHFQSAGRTAVAVDARLPSAVGLVVEAATCLDILVVPESTVHGLDMTLADSQGRWVGHAGLTDSDQWMLVCSEQRASATLLLRPHAGSGAAAIIVSRSTLTDAPAVGAKRLDLDPALGMAVLGPRVRSELSALGYQEPTWRTTWHLVAGTRKIHDLAPLSPCSRLELLLERPARGLHATLLGRDGRAAAEAWGRERVTLLACDPTATALELELQQSAGPVTLELYRENKSPPILGQFPLAASRVFARLSQALGPLRASQLGQLTSLSLVPGKPIALDTPLPNGQCVQVAVALNTLTGAVDLRAYAKGSHQELDRERCTGSASVKVCSIAASQPALIEVVIQGPAEPASALLAIRPILAPVPAP